MIRYSLDLSILEWKEEVVSKPPLIDDIDEHEDFKVTILDLTRYLSS